MLWTYDHEPRKRYVRLFSNHLSHGRKYNKVEIVFYVFYLVKMIRKVVRSQEYGVTLKLYRTQFLVDLDSEKVGRVLKLDSIKQGRLWRGMDVLVFNSWHWWTHTGHIQPYTFFCFVFVFLRIFLRIWWWRLRVCLCGPGGITWKMGRDCTKTWTGWSLITKVWPLGLDGLMLLSIRLRPKSSSMAFLLLTTSK